MNSRRYIAAVLVSTCLLGATSTTIAQQQQQQSNPVPIVVVDLSKVFEQHPTFKTQMERIKAEVKTTEAGFQQQGEAIKKRLQQLQQLKSTSAEYKTLEAEIALGQGQVQADLALKRKEFLEREAKVYYATYMQVKKEIQTFSEANRIGLVLRYSSEKMDPSNRQSVMQGVNQPIVYNQGNLDITRYIVERLVRTAGGPQTARSPSGTRRQ